MSSSLTRRLFFILFSQIWAVPPCGRGELNINIDWLSLTTFLPILGDFIPKGWRIAFILLLLFSARIGYDTRSIFKRSFTGLNSEFSFSWTSSLIKAEEPRLPYYFPMAGGRIIGFIPFQRVLVLCEMQLVSSRIWNRIAVSISYDDNHYTTGTSIKNCVYCTFIFTCFVSFFLKVFFAHCPFDNKEFFNRRISSIDCTLTGTTSPEQSEPGSHGNG